MGKGVYVGGCGCDHIKKDQYSTSKMFVVLYRQSPQERMTRKVLFRLQGLYVTFR